MKSSRAMRIEKEKGAFASESALHIMAVSRILFPEFLRGDDHLSRPNFSERPIPQLRDRDATNPRIDGPAVLPLFCLAPHGVFPASRITPRAVSSYLAFSTLPCTFLKEPAVSFL